MDPILSGEATYTLTEQQTQLFVFNFDNGPAEDKGGQICKNIIDSLKYIGIIVKSSDFNIDNDGKFSVTIQLNKGEYENYLERRKEIIGKDKGQGHSHGDIIRLIDHNYENNNSIKDELPIWPKSSEIYKEQIEMRNNPEYKGVYEKLNDIKEYLYDDGVASLVSYLQNYLQQLYPQQIDSNAACSQTSIQGTETNYDPEHNEIISQLMHILFYEKGLGSFAKYLQDYISLLSHQGNISNTTYSQNYKEKMEIRNNPVYKKIVEMLKDSDIAEEKIASFFEDFINHVKQYHIQNTSNDILEENVNTTGPLTSSHDEDLAGTSLHDINITNSFRRK